MTSSDDARPRDQPTTVDRETPIDVGVNVDVSAAMEQITALKQQLKDVDVGRG
jgi:hypothetical protein